MTTERLLELAELAKAERDGKTIQYFNHQKSKWRDKPNTGDFFEDWEYRIKPEPRVCWRNEYPFGIRGAYETKEEAEFFGGPYAIGQVKFVEVLDDEPKQTAFEISVEDLIKTCVAGQLGEDIANNIREYFKAKDGEK